MSEIASRPVFVADLLERRDSCTDKGMRFYDRRGEGSEFLAWADISLRARRWAAWADSKGLGKDDVVLICLPTGPSFFDAFLGSILLGARPVALPQPRVMGGDMGFLQRLGALIQIFERLHLIAEPWVLDSIKDIESPIPLLVEPEENELERFGDAAVFPAYTPASENEVCFYQLTSGSTASPKAVRITWSCLHANLQAMTARTGIGSEDVMVCWLPMHHDMGLVGFFFESLVNGCSVVMMRPETFLMRPSNWLRAISDHRGSVTSGPDFGYRLAAGKVAEEQLEGMDLSCLRIACIGAERVHESTMREFTDRFAPAGFEFKAFMPSYGMAESTLGITLTHWDTPPKIKDGLVFLGEILSGMKMEVRDPDGTVLEDGKEGEIHLSGSSLCAGYHPTGDGKFLQNGWLATGDIGLIDDGQLSITGRMKDIIIISGQNIAPQDLERAAEDVIRSATGCAGSFSISEDEGEQVYLVAEIPREMPEGEEGQQILDGWRREIKKRVVGGLGVPLHHLMLVQRATIPRTTSGKVQRGLLRALVRRGTIKDLENDDE